MIYVGWYNIRNCVVFSAVELFATMVVCMGLLFNYIYSLFMVLRFVLMSV